MDSNEDITFTYSSVLAKEGKPYISVMFERGADRADASIPSCKVTNSRGFSEEEVEQLEQYLKENKNNIIEKAKGITGITHWF